MPKCAARLIMEKKKSNVQLIISELLSGKALSANEISEMVLKSSGVEIEPRNVSSTLSKISHPEKCDLGLFIERKREGLSFIYQMVEAALALSEEQAYGLTLKMGDERYTPEQAVSDYPGLERYVRSAKPKSKVRSAEKKRVVKKTPPKKAPPKKAPVKKTSVKPADNTSETSNIPALAELSDASVEKFATKLIQKVDELGGLKLNVSVSFKIDGFGD